MLRGIEWFKRALAAVKKQPTAFTGIVIFAFLVSGMMSSMPYAGMVLACIWMPYASILQAFAARDSLAGKVPSYLVLAETWRDRPSRRPLISIGILSAVWMEVDSFIFAVLGRDQLAQWRISAEGVDVSSLAANFPTSGFVAAFALYLPLLALTLFSPLLIVLKRQNFTKSLFYSFFGVLKHIAPIIVFAAVLAFSGAFILIALDAVFTLMGIPSALFFAAPFFAAVCSAVAQAGIWLMYEDIFG